MAERIGFADAMACVHRAIGPTAIDSSPLGDSLDRVTASPVFAAISHPPFDCSAMDGYALHKDDLATPRLAVGRPIYAGDRAPRLRPGEALPIATGAPVPEDCGAVIQNEIAGEVIDGKLHRSQEAFPGRNIRRRGEDVAAGDLVLSAGRIVTPAIIGALACFGVTAIDVHRRPRVAILSSGAELGDSDSRIPDANGPMLHALAIEAGADAGFLGTLPDDEAAIRRRLDDLAAEADMVVTTGGISAGPRDFLMRVLASMRADILFHGIRMRPGKPAVFARMPDGHLILCLPGNPLAALIAGRFLMVQAIRAAQGLPLEQGVPVRTDQGRPGTTLVLKARNRPGGVEVLPGQRSHMLRSLADADCWVVTDERGDGTALRFSL
jgi:molybdopterin molybdotransferase